MNIVNKKDISFNRDIGLNTDGHPMEIVYLDFEPLPLLPTYSFVFNNEEVKYSLHKNQNVETELDRQNAYYLKKIK